MATLYEIIRGMQESERQVGGIMARLPGLPEDPIHRQRIEALQLILDDMPTDMGERVIE
jgi:hypothetical protein